VSDFPKHFTDDNVRNPVLFDRTGKQIKLTNRGFCNGKDLEFNDPDKPLWVIEGNTCKQVTASKAAQSSIGMMLESSNLLEVFQWLHEQHDEPGMAWHLEKYWSLSYASFRKLAMQCEDLEACLATLLASGGKATQMSDGFDPKAEAEAGGFECIEVPNLHRKVYGVLVRHPSGGDQLIYFYNRLDNNQCMASFSLPKAPRGKGPNGPTKASLLSDRLMELQRELTDIIRRFRSFYSSGINGVWVGGVGFEKRLVACYEAMKFISDHRGWARNKKRITKKLKPVLESLETRMSLRNNAAVRQAEGYFKYVTGMKLAPVKLRQKKMLVPV